MNVSYISYNYSIRKKCVDFEKKSMFYATVYGIVITFSFDHNHINISFAIIQINHDM